MQTAQEPLVLGSEEKNHSDLAAGFLAATYFLGSSILAVSL